MEDHTTYLPAYAKAGNISGLIVIELINKGSQIDDVPGKCKMN
jgi:hypothetical protein